MNDFRKKNTPEHPHEIFEAATRGAATALKMVDPDLPVTLIYHNDTDGLCSGVIMAEALKMLDRKTINYCYEQIYPVPLSKIYETAPGPIIIMDLGVGKNCLDFIRKNTGSRLTIIIDHHESDPIFIPPGQDGLFDLNCTKLGIDGDRHASASTLTYIFASKLQDIRAVSHLAVLGAFGDKNHTQGEERGRFPKNGLDYAISVIAKNIQEEDASYSVKLGNQDFKLMETIVDYINLLGSIGYRKKGSELGINRPDITGPLLAQELLLRGVDEKKEYDEINNAKKYLAGLKKDAEEYLINNLREHGCEEWDNIVYFDTQDFFKGMGVKTVGTFCSKLISDRVKKNYDFVRPDKYLMGAQLIEPVPFGREIINAFDAENVLKISIRAPDLLEEKINKTPGLRVSTMISYVNPSQIGSSHGLRGATIITRNKKTNFLNFCNMYLEGKQMELHFPELEIR